MNLQIDRDASAERIELDIRVLSGPAYTKAAHAICRYAYTEGYRNTLAYFAHELDALGFSVSYDPVGTLVARNVRTTEAAFGIGSHCDSNRNGGKYDGTLGVVAALEVCRLNKEQRLGLPLQLVAFIEEEGSGFGQMLLGSRIMTQLVTEDDLRDRFKSIDDGRSFWEHAAEAGYRPDRWRESILALEGLSAWIETHIEQGRVLQETHARIGVVTAIAGYVQGDITVRGRADHAGATPMNLRQDAGLVAAASALELERLAQGASDGTVATVGEIELTPGIINVIPGLARFSLDIRGVNDHITDRLVYEIREYATKQAIARTMEATFVERQRLVATPLDERVIRALSESAQESAAPFRTMASGAAHDTMCLAPHVPSAMLFVPCKNGISHSPAESADPADAALAVEIMLNALIKLRQ